MSEFSVRKTGFLYGFFISAPQQHLGLELELIEDFITLISQPQSRFWHL